VIHESEFSGDVMDVLGQLFEAAATTDDADTARQALTSAETVATNKLPDGEFRDRLLHGCGQALTDLDSEARRSSDSRPDADGGLELAAEQCRAMVREVDARR
jgi:hypothetical protein